MNGAQDVMVDTTKFSAPARLASAIGYMNRLCAPLELHTLAQTGYGLDARAVPVGALQCMSTHPAIYLAEQTLGGIVRRKDLFSVVHDDERWVKQTEAWLWPIMDRLLGAAVRAFAYGTVATVMDWDRVDLKFSVPAKTTGEPRKRTAKRYTCFVRAVEVHPDWTQILQDSTGEVSGLVANGQAVTMDRAHLWSWDPELGDVLGQSARRRAWRDYCESLILSLLQAKYLERSVDPARLAYAPAGTSKIDGQDVETAAHVNDLLMALNGSGAITLPSTKDKNGDPLYKVDVLAPPDRSHVWRAALDRCDRNMLLAYLVGPTVGGVETPEGGGGARMSEGMLKEFVQSLATWIATNLTRIVHLVCRANPLDMPEELPDVEATDVGKAAMLRILQQVLTLVNAAPGGEVALRTDVARVLDKLQVPVRDMADAPESAQAAAKIASQGSSPDGGQPKDFASGRQDRREEAQTDEAAEDTGTKRQAREHQEAAARHAITMAAEGTRKAVLDLQTVSSLLVARMDKEAPAPQPSNVTVNVTVPEREVINNLSVPEREVHVSSPVSVDARTTVAEGAVKIAEGAVNSVNNLSVPEREVNVDVTMPPGGGTKSVSFVRGLDGKIADMKIKE